ncbi:hypothetical protein [Pontibacter aquaedesilientis]|uniref:hypothetical protein n=1 Tax=Pontibacter aquaedesilientis TaxID=2766980 RepID=UPI001CD15548|nr:hypothetical protein [Pontibacter aquaedesilientis]
MKHLKKFLTRLQTLELCVIQRNVYGQSLGPAKDVPIYDISHETKYYDAFTFESELRLLSEMACLDLIPLQSGRLRILVDQIQGVEQRFKQFWINYHRHYDGYGASYSNHYILQIGLDKLFLVRQLMPDNSSILVEEKFVEDLGESVKLRESFLQKLTKCIQDLLRDEGKLPSVAPASSYPQPEPSPVKSYPQFVEGMAEDFAQILKGYFDKSDREQLLPLLSENQSPAALLVFHGNGNQLADAFKQLYEANLIVGCLKSDLEEWISSHFAYVLRKQQRMLPPNYLAAIISSNAKPCQSPILDVRKQPDGTYSIVPVLRTQKNYNYQ